MAQVARFVRFACPQCSGVMEVEEDPNLPEDVACGNCGRNFHRSRIVTAGDLTPPSSQ